MLTRLRQVHYDILLLLASMTSTLKLTLPSSICRNF